MSDEPWTVNESFADQVAERLIGTRQCPWYAARDLGQWLNNLELSQLVQLLESRVKPCPCHDCGKRPTWLHMEDDDICAECDDRTMEGIEDEIEDLKRARSAIERKRSKEPTQ